MENQKWLLRGVAYVCCRTNGHCPLNFGRDILDGPCKSLNTYQVTEGQIKGIDMKNIIFTFHSDGIPAKSADIIAGKKIDEGAVYIGDNATEEQKKILEPFLRTHLRATVWKKLLGLRFTKIEIKEENRTYHITSPYFEQHTALAIGGDGKNPITMGNPLWAEMSNVKFGNTDVWRYKDFGKKLEFRQSSGLIADFNLAGNY
jgi:hypothetical protein